MSRLNGAMLAALLAASALPARADDCADLRAQFDAAIASHNATAIIAANKAVEDTVVCDVDTQAYNARAIAGVIEALPRAPDIAPPQDAMTWLHDKLMLGGDWRAAEKLGKLFDARGDRRNAQLNYELALGLTGRDPAAAPNLAALKTLNNEAFAAKSLASYDAQGRQQKSYPQSTRAADGSITLYSVAMRTVGIGKMPVPVNFVYDSTEMTEGGKAAAKELAEVVMQQQLESFHLTGHADPRGDPAYNLKLSIGRAEALKKAVQDEIASHSHNYLGAHRMPDIIADGKGSAEPFDASYLPYKPNPEELYQLDRRVEFEFLNP